jgi:hypothetical protein
MADSKPAQNAVFDYDAQLACSGTAATNGATWKLIITPSSPALTVKLTGSSANAARRGSAVLSSGSGNWSLGNATAVLKVNNNIEDSKQFSFALP